MYLFTTTINNSTFPKKPSPEIVFYDKKKGEQIMNTLITRVQNDTLRSFMFKFVIFKAKF